MAGRWTADSADDFLMDTYQDDGGYLPAPPMFGWSIERTRLVHEEHAREVADGAHDPDPEA